MSLKDAANILLSLKSLSFNEKLRTFHLSLFEWRGFLGNKMKKNRTMTQEDNINMERFSYFCEAKFPTNQEGVNYKIANLK